MELLNNDPPLTNDCSTSSGAGRGIVGPLESSPSGGSSKLRSYKEGR